MHDNDSSGGDSELLRELAAAPAVSVPVDFATLVLLEPGTIIGDAFRIEERLGSGGMGVVYAARDLKLDREVAIKLMRLERGTGSLGATLPKVFEREARATARLNHPNIVTLYQFGSWNGILYLVLERLRGETLATRIARGGVTLRLGLAIMEAVAHALVHTHAAGIVHRDLKPQNVFLLANGGVKVLDFGVSGLAYAPAETRSRAAVARDGARSTLLHAGTPGYMAPEQWRGEPHDARTDIWAVGVMLYQVATDKLPFGATPITTQRTLPPLPEAAAEITPLIERCLSEPCSMRPDAAELASALRYLQRGGEGVAASAAAGTPATARVYPRRRARPVLLGLAIASIVGGLAAAVVSTRGTQEPHCDGVSAQLDGVWDGLVKARMVALFTATGADGSAAWRKVELAGDRYAAEWLTLGKAACVAGNTDQLATACLADARSALRAFVENYTHSSLDTPQLAAAIGDIGALPPLSRCVSAASTTPSGQGSGARLVLTINGAGKEVVHGAVKAGDDVIVAGYMSPGGTIAGVRFESRRTGESQGVIARIGAGRVRWRQVMTHGSMTSIADGGAGRVVVAGRYLSPSTFAGREMPALDESCFVASLDAATGDVVWIHTCGGSLSVARGVASDHEGNVYAVGDFAGRARFGGDVEIDASARPMTAPYVASWTRDGTLRWVTTGRGTAVGESFAIAVDGESVIIGARLLGAGHLGNHPLLIGGCVLARLDRRTGAVVWLRETAGATGDCKVRSVAIRGDRIAAGGSEIERAAGWVSELALVDGSVLWTKSFAAHVSAATPPVRSVAYAPTGDLIVGGYFNTDRLVTGCAPLVRRGTSDAFVLRLAHDGHCLAAHQLGGAGEEVMIRWVGVGTHGSVLAAGRYQKALTVDAAPVDSAGSSDGFLVELPSSW